jgi:hypothetical protein
MMQMRTPPGGTAARYPHLGAFESTKLMGSGTDILAALVSMLKTSAALRLENLALR